MTRFLILTAILGGLVVTGWLLRRHRGSRDPLAAGITAIVAGTALILLVWYGGWLVSR